MKFLGNAVVFVALYLVFMIPTYYLPYKGSNSAVIGAIRASAEAGINPYFWLHLAALLALVVITWFRGVLIDKKWLLIFPLLAAVFDLAPLLSVIPLVPTVMHLLAIILGVALKTAPPVSSE